MTMTRDAFRAEQSEPHASGVPDDLVNAALQAAQELGKDVADVPVAVIARHAGMSRSTLLRRLNGSRTALDQAVRARGIDPGGVPVRIRAIEAAAVLISEQGLATATLEMVAQRADCSLPSVYANFGTRDSLLRAVFEQYSPIHDVEEFFAQPHGDLHATVRAFYGVIAQALSRQPRVVPAVFAEAFARPASPAVQSLVRHATPRMLGHVGGWLAGEVDAGRIRDLPIPLLVQQLMAPMLIHQFTRPIADTTSALGELPDIDTVCDVFADAFVRAVAAPRKRKRT
jgi:AcrR family transcriptional regulator